VALYCGTDLYANNSEISIIDGPDAILDEKRHRNDLPEIRDMLESCRQDSFFQLAR